MVTTSIPGDREVFPLSPPHRAPPFPWTCPPLLTAEPRAQLLTRRCQRRPRAGAWTGTLCHAWHTATAPGAPLCGSCVGASWGRGFRESGKVSGFYSHLPHPTPGPLPRPCFLGLPTHWCSIWKLRCPLNQSLKADLWTLHVAWSWRRRSVGSISQHQSQGQSTLARSG